MPTRVRYRGFYYGCGRCSIARCVLECSRYSYRIFSLTPTRYDMKVTKHFQNWRKCQNITRIVASAGHFLINSSIKSSELRDTAKVIDQTLLELGFDPSSDVKICQYDPSMFEQWFMIKKTSSTRPGGEFNQANLGGFVEKTKKYFAKLQHGY